MDNTSWNWQFQWQMLFTKNISKTNKNKSYDKFDKLRNPMCSVTKTVLIQKMH